MAEPLLEVRGLEKHFKLPASRPFAAHPVLRAVDGVSFAVARGESFGVVGESGSGKTTLGKAILRLIEPTRGEIIFNGVDIGRLGERELQRYRAQMQMVFQDPYSSLNPRMRVKDIVAEPLRVHGVARGNALMDRVRDLIRVVGLMPDHLYRFPHEFSGGQRQRIGIARAIALHPLLLVLDEPTSALDVSVQAQILNLLISLQREFDLTYLFISHDLGVIRYICDRVAIMYLGRIVEVGSVGDIFTDPKHPYTIALLSAMPEPDPDQRAQEIVLSGEITSPVGEMRGCRFASRCPVRFDRCLVEDPQLLTIGEGHAVACHLQEGKAISAPLGVVSSQT
jgi:oligopeptide/dipeptide ABC transporter ATP-binding protein